MKQNLWRTLTGGVLAALLSGPTLADTPASDPYLWLEEVQGEKALAFVQAQNARTLATIGQAPVYAPIESAVRRVLDSKARIPTVQVRAGKLYNFWRDADHPRGVWRRTSWEEYRKTSPAWETVLDLDALAAAEHENWVWAGAQCLPLQYERCLIKLSRGGSDASVHREFDVTAKAFVVDGFVLPEAKSDVAWRDLDTLYVATDFGPGSLTESGYPRIVKRWKRGSPLSEAVTVYEGKVSDLAVSAWVDHTPGFEREGIERAIGFYEAESLVLKNGALVAIDVPRDAVASLVREWLVVRLRSDWTPAGKTFKAGALLAINARDFDAGKRAFEVLFEPTPSTALQGWSATRTAIVLNVLDKVRSRVVELVHRPGGWSRREVRLPGLGAATAQAVDPFTSNDYWITYQDFLTPSSLALARVAGESPKVLKTLPAFFDTTGLKVSQFEAVSRDGTRVPYFVVGMAGKAAGFAAHAPTLLYGYGGFEQTMEPWYSGSFGQAWLTRGGTFVLANIRGGGEFGPGWHQAALKEKRQNAFDDFIAVAQDLVARGLTTREQLGIMGGSNGGLLVGAVMVQRPDLVGAVVCQVPLLDMRRYNVLLAGASWMSEYGNPDREEDWAYLSKYSPYQNVKAGVKYPAVLFTTSTRDDRVHPGHARKMVARMEAQGHTNVWYYENTEGGHAGAANNEQRARMVALEFSFLWQQLGGTGAQR